MKPENVNEAETNRTAEAQPRCAPAAGSVVEMHVNYYNGKTRTHGYDESWEKLALHCPNCGEKQVWHETSGGDYYVEERYLCTACNHGFYLPGCVHNKVDDEQSKQRLESLKANPPNDPDQRPAK